MPHIRLRPDRILVSETAIDQATHTSVVATVLRHLLGDWGDADETERALDETALAVGLGVVTGIYPDEDGPTLFVRTDIELGETILFLAAEYLAWMTGAAHPALVPFETLLHLIDEEESKIYVSCRAGDRETGRVEVHSIEAMLKLIDEGPVEEAVE